MAIDISVLLQTVENKIEEILVPVFGEIELMKFPINIEQVVKCYGINLEFRDDMPDIVSGFCYVKTSNQNCQEGILINNKHHKHRKRFAIAHEFGHYISYKLQNKGGRHIDYYMDSGLILANEIDDGQEEFIKYEGRAMGELSSLGTDLEEIYANRFAASILMPKVLLTYELSKYRDIKKLANKFEVSELAMQYRLSSLDFVNNL